MIIEEMERLEEDYWKASEVEWGYLNLLRSNYLPGLSQRTRLTGTTLTTGMLKQCNVIQSCTQTGLCANTKQNKRQYRYASVKSGLIVTSHIDNTDIFYCSRQSDTNVHISNALY